MAVTRIKNNQITDASNGNTQLGVNAAVKLQNYTITSTKIANNLVYGSDLTVTGNLTVQGNTTTIDTTITTIEDPVIVLASTQTSGAPTVDIGFLGYRGNQSNIAFVWDENASEFVTAFTDTGETSTTINITSYANFHTNDANVAGNLTIGGNIDITGNITSLNVTGNISGGNLLTSGLVSATGNITGGNVNTAGLISATGNVTGGNIDTAGTVSATGTVTGGNIATGGTVSATGTATFGNVDTGGTVSATGTITSATTITGGNLATGGTVSATGDVTGGNLITGGTISSTGTATVGNLATAGTVSATGNVTGNYFIGNGSQLTGVVAANMDANLLTGNTLSGNVTFSSLTSVGSLTSLSVVGTATVGNLDTSGTVSATGNVTGGNLTTGGLISATGTVTAGNLATGGTVSATGTVTGGNIDTAGTVSATGTITSATTITGGNLATGGTVSATGTVTGGNVDTAGTVSATGNVTGGNLTTGGQVSATSTITGGNLATGGTVSATGNITGGNVLTGGLISATGTITSADTITGGNIATGGTVSATGNVTGGNVLTSGVVSAGSTGTFGDVNTAGNVSATGNVTAGNVVTNFITNTSGDVSISAANNLVLDPVGNIVLDGGKWINNVNDPVKAQDAATKQYVDDAVSSGIHIHTPVLLESPTAINGTYVQGGNTFTVNQTIAGNTVVFTTAANLQTNDELWFTSSFEGILGNTAYFVVSAPNTSAAVLSLSYSGAPVTTVTSNTGLTESVRVNSGVGATLTNAGANATLVIDGVTTSNGDRLLIYTQANAVQNGVYDVTEAGNATTAWQLVRSSDADKYIPDSSIGLDEGSYFYVQSGDSGAGESYVQTAPSGPFIIGYDNITFTQFSASQVYTANTNAGLSLTGTVFSAKVDNNTTAFDLGGNIIVKAGANLTTPNIGDATGTTLSLTGNVTSGNVLTGGFVSSTGNVTGGNVNTAGLISATGNVTGNYFIGNGSQLTGVVAANMDANLLTGNTLSGNVTFSSLTSVGNLTSLSVVGTTTTGNLDTAGTVSATGNVTGGNVLTGGLISATGNVTGGNVTTIGVVTATGTITGGNLDTGGTVSATGNVTAGNVNTAGLISATGNVTGGNVDTAGLISATGNVTGGNVNTAGLISATGNVTGGNIDTTGNVTGGNVLTGGLISATGNITGGNLLFGAGVVSGTGNIFADTIFANISGNIDAGGANTNIQFNDDDVLAGSPGFTFDKVGNAVTANGNITGTNLFTGGLVSATSNITGGNILTGGLISATGTITSDANVIGGNITTAGLITATGNITGGNIDTAGLITATGNITGGNIDTAGLITATGNITGGNLILTGAALDTTVGRLTVNSTSSDADFAVNGNTLANVFYIDAGTGTVSFGTSTQVTNAIVNFDVSTSIKLPVGNIGQRPSTGVTGMARFNTTNNNLEIYDNSEWTAVGVPSFTVIADEQFAGDGSTVAFTLGSTQTTNSCIVSINGVVQIPILAYAVAGTDPNCVLTFTEAPASGDLIDVRQITTTTTVTSISNSSGNAVVSVSDTAALVNVTGDLSVSGTILGGNINSTAITNGTSNVRVVSSGGNIAVTVGGNGIVSFTTAGIINNMGNGVGNIGNATGYFDTIFAKATSAQYADLAEKYTADADYEPGTVVMFGGSEEVTLCVNDACSRVAGVISTNPSYRMNDGLISEHTAMVALTGRVPTQVTGTVRKGDMMVSAGNGRARAEADPRVGTVIGKALADFDGAEGVIEVVVGRF